MAKRSHSLRSAKKRVTKLRRSLKKSMRKHGRKSKRTASLRKSLKKARSALKALKKTHKKSRGKSSRGKKSRRCPPGKVMSRKVLKNGKLSKVGKCVDKIFASKPSAEELKESGEGLYEFNLPALGFRIKTKKGSKRTKRTRGKKSRGKKSRGKKSRGKKSRGKSSRRKH